MPKGERERAREAHTHTNAPVESGEDQWGAVHKMLAHFPNPLPPISFVVGDVRHNLRVGVGAGMCVRWCVYVRASSHAQAYERTAPGGASEP